MPDYYAPQTWFNGPTGGTPVSAARLNHMEAGIDAVDSAVQAVETDVAALMAATPSEIVSNGEYAAAGTVVLRTRVTADPQPRWVLHAGGLQEWGDGTNPVDTNLQRTAPHTLVTGSDFIVGGNNLYNTVSAASSLVVSYFQAGSATQTPIMARGFAAQSANLTEWQASTGSVLSRVASDGVMYGPGFFTGTVAMTNAVYTPSVLSLSFTGPTLVFDGHSASLRQSAGDAANTVLEVKGATSQTGRLIQFQDSTSAQLAQVRYDGLIGAPYFTNTADSGPYFQMLANAIVAADRGTPSGSLLDLVGGAGRTSVLGVASGDVASVGLIVKGYAGQTAVLQAWEDSTTVTKAFIAANGRISSRTVQTGAATTAIDFYGADIATGIATYGIGMGDPNVEGSIHYRAGDADSSAYSHQFKTNERIRFVIQADGIAFYKAIPAQTVDLTQWRDSSNVPLFGVTVAGLPKWNAAGNQQTTVGAAGGASALPATPTKYLKVLDSAGTVLVIPAYAAA